MEQRSRMEVNGESAEGTRTAERPEDPVLRTKRSALAVIERISGLPSSDIARVLGKQVLRSGTSIGANYREGRRGRSKSECSPRSASRDPKRSRPATGWSC
ncbi:MAG: four helix bundle protein [Flavobacteriales bacterium]|nr:four helix bundle protein [Flavobacteriales bacterium]